MNAAAKKGESVGSVVFAAILAIFSELFLRAFSPIKETFGAFGRVAIVFLALFALYYFASLSLSSIKKNYKDLFCLISIVFGCIFMAALGGALAGIVASHGEVQARFGDLRPSSLYFGVPFAVGALLLQAILGLHYALIGGLALTIVIGVYFPIPSLFVPYVFVTSLVAAMSLLRFRSRSSYLKAGLNVALISIPFVLAWVVMVGSKDIGDAAAGVIAALIGGILCSFVAAGVTPIIETVGGYVTDMRLLEMATLDNPLLKELSIQAPGTWNHSMVMGMMVESAADAIGANPVLSRVGAYFHDVGKTKKPIYFVENQLGDSNPHDKLSPSMSALVIRSHVKDGIELARKQKLPEPIVDMIPQHHGTFLIEYFYDKACKEAKDEASDQEVDRTLYTYPGPKPQTKEAALLMLADGIEASARTLTDPSLDRIQGLVQKMINKVFSSGQLNECDLTLRDLHLIAKCFTRVLNGIYHQRIAYAEPAEKVNPRQKVDETEEYTNGKAQQQKEPEEAEEPERKEDLKRLGQEEL